MLKEFKEFAIKGNMMDMAAGIIIGAAFGTVVKSLVDDILMPPVGMLLGGVDFSNIFSVIKEGATAGPYSTVEAAAEAGAVTMNWGLFINSLISFVIVAFALFIVIKGLNRLKREQEQAAVEPAEPPRQEVLLQEIRDLLKSR